MVAEQGTSLYVFDEPATGWSGALAPDAVLTLPEPEGDGYAQSLAIGASAIAAEDADGHGSVFVFGKPATGWRNSSLPARLRPPPLADSNGFATHATYGRHMTEIEIADLNRGPAGLDVTVGQNSLRMRASLSRRIAALAHKRRATVRIPIVLKLEVQARRSRHAMITFAAR